MIRLISILLIIVFGIQTVSIAEEATIVIHRKRNRGHKPASVSSSKVKKTNGIKSSKKSNKKLNSGSKKIASSQKSKIKNKNHRKSNGSTKVAEKDHSPVDLTGALQESEKHNREVQEQMRRQKQEISTKPAQNPVKRVVHVQSDSVEVPDGVDWEHSKKNQLEKANQIQEKMPVDLPPSP